MSVLCILSKGGTYFLVKNPLLVKLAKPSAEKINSLNISGMGILGGVFDFSLCIEFLGHNCYDDEKYSIGVKQF